MRIVDGKIVYVNRPGDLVEPPQVDAMQKTADKKSESAARP